MRLFFKHIFRGMRKRPLQPLILILTIMLSVSISILAIGIKDAFARETDEKHEARYGSADITVSLNGLSASRFMFSSDAKALMPEGTSVAGSYELPMFLGEEKRVAFGAAVDFYEIEDIFSFTFVQKGEIYASAVSESALITESFAAERGLLLGDSFEAEILGESLTYRVAAISASRYLTSYDVLVDIRPIVSLITKDSPILSAISSDIMPFGTLYIDLPDGADVSECKRILESSDNFSDKTLSDMEYIEESRAYSQFYSTVVEIIIMLSCVLCAAVSFCCLYILSSERVEENAVFVAAGARYTQMNFMQYAEIFIYWIVGVLLGVPLSLPLMSFTFRRAGFEYANAMILPRAVIYSSLITLVVALCSVSLFVSFMKSKRKGIKPRRGGKIIPPILLALLALSLFATVFAPVKSRIVFGAVSALTLLLTVFILTPGVTAKIAKKVAALCGKKSSPDTLYAMKNVCTLKLLHNFSRLVALLTVIILSAVFVIAGVLSHVETSKAIFKADYIVVNASERCYKSVVDCEAVDSGCRMFFAGSSDTEVFANMISVEDISFVSDNLRASEKPQGNEAVVSRNYADYNSLSVGDTFEVGASGVKVTLVVKEIVPSGVSYILFDAPSLGLPYNMVLADGKDNLSSSEVLSAITEATSSKLAAVMPTEDLMEDKIRSINIYLSSALVLLSVIGVFSVIGICDNLGECYRSRRGEFLLYAYAGMKSRTVKRMKLWEIASSLLIGAAVGVFAFIFAAVLLDRAMTSFAYELMTNILDLFN